MNSQENDLIRGFKILVAVLMPVLLVCCKSGGDLPENSSNDTKLIYEKASSFYANDKGYWEAELQNEFIVVQIPSSDFQMGSNQGEAKELPIHKVNLDDYWISKYPITVDQFAKFVEATGYVTDAEKGEGCWIEEGGSIRYDVSWREPNFEQAENHPVICVSWNDATAYTKWLSIKIGLNIQLPTEAQWEKAARGSDQRLWPWGNDLPDGSQANFAESQYIKRFGKTGRNPSSDIDDRFPQTSPVNAYPEGQSPYGVYDMSGNVIDWLYDWFDESYYSKSPVKNPIGISKNPIRMKHEIPGGWGDNLQRSIRGGAWTDASGELSLAEGGHSIRSDMREQTNQYSSDDHLGFRFVIDNRYRYTPYRDKISSTTQATVLESIGSTEVTIDYDRLLTDGEKLAFGITIPYGEPWSPGNNSTTVFSVSKPITIHGKTLLPGSYNFYIIPEEISPNRTPGQYKDWTIIYTQPASHIKREFNPEEEVLRVKTRAKLEDNSKQQMEYFFEEVKGKGRILRFLFEFVEVHIPILDSAYSPNEISKAMVMNAMGSTEVKVNYYRTVAANRKIYGDVVPYNRPWPGINRPTTIEFSEDVFFQNQKLPKGKYFLNIIPKEGKDWTLILSDTIGNQKSKVFNEQVKVSFSESGGDRLEYYFDYVSETERNLILTWDKATIAFNIKKNTVNDIYQKK